MPFLRSLVDLTLVDVADIALVSVFVYAFLAGLRRVRLRGLAFGVLGLGVVYGAAQVFGLGLTVYLFHLSAALFGLALVIMYHGEIRDGMERVLTRLSAPREQRGARDDSGAWVGALVDSVREMARRKTGALVVVQGRDDPHRHLSGGTVLDGEVSEALLLSVFDPGSLGHDGAMLVRAGRVAGFQYHLPLSTDHGQLYQRGTRHAAALGLAERCDALCLVVSEERGTVSVARDGALRVVDPETELPSVVGSFAGETAGEVRRAAPFWAWSRVRPKLGAALVAYALWFVFVHEGQVEYRSYTARVGLVGLGEGVRLGSASPREVRVVVSGPRRAFYFVGSEGVRVEAVGFDLEGGEHELTLTASDIVLPPGLTFVNILPRTVEVRLEAE